MKKGAIFDMDGLLLDTERLYVEGMEQICQKYGVPHTQELEDALAGTNGARAVEVLHSFFPSIDAAALMEECNAWVRARLERDVPLKPGAKELPAWFRSCGIKTAVASSTERSLVLRNLRLAGLDGLFDAIVCGEDVERGKPAPDIFLLAAKQLGCSPKDCFVFEDSISGCRAGIAAGCATVMVIDLFPPAEDLKTGCAGIFNSLPEAMEALKVCEKGECDSMTGFLDKSSLKDALASLCPKSAGILMIIDLDCLKPVNEFFGYSMGDRVLIRFSQILKELLGPFDLVGRMGGDEFIAFCPGAWDKARVTGWENTINGELDSSAEEFGMDDHQDISLGASIGAVVVPAGGAEFAQLYKKADKALYIVKKNGKHGLGFYRGDAEQK